MGHPLNEYALLSVPEYRIPDLIQSSNRFRIKIPSPSDRAIGKRHPSKNQSPQRRWK
jgi:hypothetical protein